MLEYLLLMLEAQPLGRPSEIIAFENRYDNIGENFRLISETAHPVTGLFPAVDPHINTPESKENHMQESWIRDWSMIQIGMIESAEKLREITQGKAISDEIAGFVRRNIATTLDFLDQHRWTNQFKQPVIVNEWYTELSKDPPEVHMKQDGDRCKWDQNQPEAWGEFLIAIGRAKETGIIDEYSPKQMKFIKTIAGYLTRIQPWEFESAAMWEGLPGRSPTSRSDVVAIAKGLDAVSPLFQDVPLFQKQVDFWVEMDMAFVRFDIDSDYTMPKGHPDGADLAMLVTMALPDSDRTRLPFAEYVDRNGGKLGIGELPGAIRYINDPYKRGEMGEARWFMADPVLAIGYFKEAKLAFENGDFQKAEEFRRIAKSRLRQSRDIENIYGYPPELFIPRKPDRLGDNSNALLGSFGENPIALVPLERSLLWNKALIMSAISMDASYSLMYREQVA